MSYSIDLSEPGALEQHLEARALAFENGDLSAALRECLEIGKQDTASALATKVSPSGEVWPPRKDPGDGHPLEILSGSMAEAATGGAGHIAEVNARDMKFGVDLDAPRLGAPQVSHSRHNLAKTVPEEESLIYARAQNYGFPEGNLPARTFLGISQRGKQECTRLIGNQMDTIQQAVP